jgi:aspartyl-tRNA(Asn)/glutamyl-tRNA(Gln) amidotransferase subunit B
VIRAGGRVILETRLYDSARNATFSMRSKEEAQDYRYFPDPDLVPVQVSDALIEKLRSELPELPQQKKRRYVSELGLPSYDAELLTGSTALSGFFEQAVKDLGPKGAKPTANLLLGEVLRLVNDEGIELKDARIRPEHVSQIVRLLQAQEISSTGAKAVVAGVWKTGEPVDAIVAREGLKQVNDLSAFEPIVDALLIEFPAQASELKGGKEKLMGFFVGQAMKRSTQKANPALLQELIKKRLGQ